MRHQAETSRTLLCTAFFLLALTLLFPAMTHARKVKSFSADLISMDPQGQVEDSSKIYMTPEKVRMEGVAPDGEGEMITIIRRDRQVHWILNPEKKAYLERPLDEKEVEVAFMKDLKPKKEEDLGTEKVNGYKCRKKRVTTEIDLMGYKRTIQSTIWVSDKFDMPLRTLSDDGAMTELRNIKKGKPKKALFEIPAGYTQVDHIFALFDPPARKSSRKQTAPAPKGGMPQIPEEVLKQLPEEVREMLLKGNQLPEGVQQ